MADVTLESLGIDDAEVYDLELDPEVQTDKKSTKTVPCKNCRRALVVTTFFAPAKALCMTCRGEGEASGVAAVAKPVPGKTDPAKAIHLADALLNPGFAHAICPFDAGHTMELKSISHNPNYGPTKLLRIEKGMPVYDTEMGETVMHQCTECKTTITYSTVHTCQYRRQNEPKPSSGNASAYLFLLGEREEDEKPAADAA